MSDETITSGGLSIAARLERAASLDAVADAQIHELLNVQALLQAAASVTQPGDPVDEDQSNRMRRLVLVAEEHVRELIADLGEYV